MSWFYWKKATSPNKTGTLTHTTENEAGVAVSVAEPLPVQLIHPDENEIPPVKIEQGWLPPVKGVSITRDPVEVPGIGTGAAYTAADAFGTLITIPNVFRPGVNTGTITKVVFYDADDEGIQKDVICFKSPMTTTADNAAFAPSDVDILAADNAISITSFFNWSSNQLGVWNGSAWVKSDDTNLYIRLVTQGADNIAAGAIPRISVTVVPD